jgi:drug/metabolite transporter (DMT)-like permease
MNADRSPSAPSTPAAAALLAAAPAMFVLLWSTGYIGARLGLPDAEPFTFLLLRFAIAGTILAAAGWIMGASWPSGRRAWLASIGAGALIQGVYLGGVFWAISRGLPAGIAALIVALQPLLTAILAGLILRERILPAHWAGLAIGLAGLSLVLAPGLEWGGRGITPLTVSAVLAAVLGIVLGSIGQKAFATHADLRTGTCLQYVGGAIVVGVAAVFTESFRIDWTPAFSVALAWLVLALSIGAVMLYMLLLRHGDVARTATLFYLVPPVTALTAWLMFGETLTPVQLVGMAVTVGGVALATRRPRG